MLIRLRLVRKPTKPSPACPTQIVAVPAWGACAGGTNSAPLGYQKKQQAKCSRIICAISANHLRGNETRFSCHVHMDTTNAHESEAASLGRGSRKTARQSRQPAQSRVPRFRHVYLAEGAMSSPTTPSVVKSKSLIILSSPPQPCRVYRFP